VRRAALGVAVLLATAAPGVAGEATRDVLELVRAGELEAAGERLAAARAEERLPPREADLLAYGLRVAGRGEAGAAALVEDGRALARAARPEDLALLRELDAAVGARRNYLEPLRRAAYRAIDPDLARGRLLRVARDADDPRAARLAVSALAAQLRPLRRRVDEGGSLSADEQRALASPDLVDVLVARLEPPGPGDRLPARMAARTPGAATARHALALVEAPALRALEAAVAAGRPGAAAAKAAVEAEVASRLERWPDSHWACARGEARLTVLTALRCPPPCGELVPPGARFCPTCGVEVRRPCPACGELLAPGSHQCAACGAGELPPGLGLTCAGCGAVTAAPAAFCPHCGGPLGDGGR